MSKPRAGKKSGISVKNHRGERELVPSVAHWGSAFFLWSKAGDLVFTGVVKTMDVEIKVLFVADARSDVVPFVDQLREQSYMPSWKRVESPEGLVGALRGSDWDLVFCDCTFPSGVVNSALEVIDQGEFDVPIIVISDVRGLEHVASLIKRGVRDFISRNDLDRLGTIVHRELKEREKRRLRRARAEEVRRLADHDALTDLPNRRLFRDRLDQGLKRARRHDSRLALLYVDLDRVKQVNDTLGHAAGDDLIRAAAERLTDGLRATDTVARVGGDEFIIIVDELNDPRTVEQVTVKILRNLACPFRVCGGEAWISASVGIATYPMDGTDGDTLVANADHAMYQAKRKGGNRFAIHSPDHDPSRDRDPPATAAGVVPSRPAVAPRTLPRPRAGARRRAVPPWAMPLSLGVILALVGWLVLGAMAFISGPSGNTPLATDGDMEVPLAPASGPAEIPESDGK